MNDKEIIVAYPHEIKIIDKNGGAISYYVDRKVSDCVKELQDKLSKVESENRQKDIDKLQLQSNWNSLREIIKECYKRYEDSNIELNDTYKYYLNSPLPPRYTMNLGAIELTDYLLDKMNELEGKDKEC